MWKNAILVFTLIVSDTLGSRAEVITEAKGGSAPTMAQPLMRFRKIKLKDVHRELPSALTASSRGTDKADDADKYCKVDHSASLQQAQPLKSTFGIFNLPSPEHAKNPTGRLSLKLNPAPVAAAGYDEKSLVRPQDGSGFVNDRPKAPNAAANSIADGHQNALSELRQRILKLFRLSM